MRAEKQILTREQLNKTEWYENSFQLKVVASKMRSAIQKNETDKRKETEKKKIDEENARIEQQKRRSRAGVVYMIQGGSHYKIGKTVDVRSRLTQIKLLMPFPVSLVHTVETNDVDMLEKHWHQRFSNNRINGEWFILSEEEVTEFKSVIRVEMSQR